MKKLLNLIRKHKFKSFFVVLALILIIYVFGVLAINTSFHKLKTDNPVTVNATLISDGDFLNAVKFGTLNEVEDMLDLGANPNAVDENGKNAMIISAIYRHDPQIIKILKDSGVDINHADTNGYTALMYSYFSGNSKQFIQELINNKADVNAKTITGNSVLMIALGLTNNVDLIKPLLSNKVNINYANDHKVTPLMVAAKSANNPDIINLLLKAGANTKAVDDLGINAYDIIQTNDQLKNNKQLVNKLK
ncbi:ankyrin repeat domain-containing protein [Rickettsiales bacterium LUAb2]